MQVEVFSDVVCPWCYIGKRHLEQALSTFPHADDVTVTYRSFQLDPTTPRDATGTLTERLAAKYGVSEEQAQQMNDRVTGVAAEAGLDYHLEDAHPANTLDAHRLLHFATTQGKQVELKERLLAAYFVEGKRIGDHEVLADEAAAVGLDRAEAVAVLAGGEYAGEVEGDFSLARSFGINSVPFFVIDRKYGLAGAQPAATIRANLEQAWIESHPLTIVATPAAAQDGDNCADGVCRV